MILKNIDVTLRDGGYRNRFNFSMDYIIDHILNLKDSGIDYVEVGYRNINNITSSVHGITATLTDKQLEQIVRNSSKVPIVVMVRPKNVTVEDIQSLSELGISMIRFIMDDSKKTELEKYVARAKSFGLKVSSNLIRVTHFNSKTLLEKAVFSEKIGCDIIYIADSNGHMLPEDVTLIISELKERTKLSIGFHAHDHLGLALSNSISAIEAGAHFIDSSLNGMGKGPGNLRLETWLAFLKRKYTKAEYDLLLILQQIEKLHFMEKESKTKYSFEDMLMGFFDMSIDDKLSVFKDSKSISEFFDAANSFFQKKFLLKSPREVNTCET